MVAVGLCERCRHAHRVTSSKGSTFWRCRISERDPTWPKYPPLPVRACSRFASVDPLAGDGSDDP